MQEISDDQPDQQRRQNGQKLREHPADALQGILQDIFVQVRSFQNLNRKADPCKVETDFGVPAAEEEAAQPFLLCRKYRVAMLQNIEKSSL